jgi:hypothetical protein
VTEPRLDRAIRARRRRRAVVGASVVILASLVLGLGALIASDALRLDSGPGPALAEHVGVTTTSERSDASRKCRAHLTPDDPLRLWIAGDSLAGSLGPSLGARAAATGIVQPTYDARVSSGLSSPEFFDWPEHATAEMARLDPEVVVFIVGANDWKTPSSDGDWEDEYRTQVEELFGILQDGGDTRHVYWVGAPTMQERRKDEGVEQVNAIAHDVVDQHARATYVNAYELFSGEDGYSATLPGPSGKSVRVRSRDGIHFTVEGGDRLGDFVYAQLEPRCRLAEQAVADQAKTVLRTRGSDGPSGGSGGASDSSGTTGSTSPATLPPATAVPVPAPVPEPDTTPTAPATPEPPAPPEPEPPESQTEP